MTAGNVLFVHGWASHPDAYSPALESLRGNGLNVHAPILPGHGGRGPVPVAAGDTVLPVLADDVVADWAFQDTEPVAVVGHSLGAGVAVEIALRHPSKVSSLALVTPIGGDGDLSPKGFARLLGGGLHDTARRFGRKRERRAAHRVPGQAKVAMDTFRHPVFAARVGLAAKGARLTDAIRHLAARGMPIHIASARSDKITVPLPRIPGVCHDVVAGFHTWPTDDPAAFAGWLSQRALAT